MKPFKGIEVKQLVKDKKNIHGFKVPKNYFETFDDRLFDNMKRETLPKHSGFQVPEGYFTTVEDSIFKKINVSEKTPKVISLFQKQTLLYIASIAACVVIIVSVVKTNTNSNIDIDDIELSHIDTYIEDGNIELYTDEVLAMLEYDEIVAIDFDYDLFSEQNLEEYLLENIDDNSLLIE